jgi:hypothetical protein
MSTQKSIITGYIAYALKTQDGKELLRGAKPFDSLLRNFIVMLETLFKGMDTKFPPPSPSQIQDTSGTYKTLTFPLPEAKYGIPLGWRVDAEAGDTLELRDEPTDWGIMVGYGDSPTTINFWKLENPYPHGRGVGYMNYLGTKVTEPTFDGTYVKFTIQRLIANEADQPQYVREVGLIAREYYTWTRFLIARDVITPQVTMPPKSLLEVTIVLAGIMAPYNIFFRKDFAVGYQTSQRSIV